MSATIQGISVRDLLRGVFTTMKETLNGEAVPALEETMAEVADDSDWHRSRTGYMKYEEIFVARIVNAQWVIAFGVAYGSYPVRPYNCEILAIPLAAICEEGDAGRNEKIQQALPGCTYFANALIAGLANGNVACLGDEGPLKKEVMKRVWPLVGNYIARDREVNRDLLDPNNGMQPVTTQTMQYKQEFVPVMAGILIAILG